MSSKKSRTKAKRAAEDGSPLRTADGSVLSVPRTPPDPLSLQTPPAGSSISFTVIDFIEKADDKTPRTCRSRLAQLSLASMKTCGASIGRPLLLSSCSGRQEVCLGWPAATFPGWKVGLQNQAQKNLGVTCGEEVTVQPVSGPVLQAQQLLLSFRSRDDSLETEDFKNFLVRSLAGSIVLPGNLLSFTYFGRWCSLRVESIRGAGGAAAPPSVLDSTSADLCLQLNRLSVEEQAAAGTPGRPGTAEPREPGGPGTTEPGPAASTPCRLAPPPLASPACSTSPLFSPQSLCTGPEVDPETWISPEPMATPAGALSSDTFYCVSLSTRVLFKSRVERAERAEAGEEAQKSKVTFEMIGGLSSQLDTVRETIQLPLRHPQLFSTYGIPPPRGVLLYGPPGTGKTMIGRAVANEVGAHMTVINGPEIMSRFYGETEARLRQIFSEATQRQPSIIFIDELDALCPKRDAAQNQVEKRVVSSLLTLMDGIGSEGSSGQLLVLGATNRPEALDPALRRPGRFDRELEVGVPGAADRADILRKLLRSVPCNASGEELTRLADAAHGYVGADLAAVCKEAGLNALRRALATSSPAADRRLAATVTVSLQDLRFAMSVVKPSAMREVAVDVPKVCWSDVGGMEEVKLKLRQAVEWPLKHPEAFTRMGIRPPRGILLYGPPGCSKTMIAKALANESGLNFLSVKGPELLNKFVGESERAVREVFRKARAVAPSIVFFDEIDALASERGSSSGGAGVSDRVLAQLLTELDGVEQLQDVTVLAASNRPDMIDKALMRPGRLDRIIYVPLPDSSTRREIFRLQFSGMPVEGNVSLEDLVNQTERYSGAEVSAVCREAALQALQEDLDSQIIQTRHFQRALISIRPRVPDWLLQSYSSYQQQQGGGGCRGYC